MSRPTSPVPAVALLSLLVTGATAGAGEYCVSCTGPEARYRCSVGNERAGDARAWLMCITELAREGGHESCSVDRKAAAPCQGLEKVLTLPEGGAPAVPFETAAPVPPPPALPPPTSAPPGAAPGSHPAPSPASVPDEAAPKKPPATVVELAGETYEKSKEGLKNAGESVTGTAKKAGEAVTDTAKKAGDAVGGAAKKTWNCLTSLFQDC